MRHRGIQHDYRMKELAHAIVIANGEVHEAFQKIRAAEQEVYKLRAIIFREETKKKKLLEVQNQLMECQIWTEFGLPPEIEKEAFELITGQKITS